MLVLLLLLLNIAMISMVQSIGDKRSLLLCPRLHSIYLLLIVWVHDEYLAVHGTGWWSS